jgi:hypothetical protein
LTSSAFFEGILPLEEEDMMLAEEDFNDGTLSRSLTPEGVKGVRESVKCQAPSGRRTAIRIS